MLANLTLGRKGPIGGVLLLSHVLDQPAIGGRILWKVLLVVDDLLSPSKDNLLYSSYVN
jgi:hypothetical protein